MISISPERLSTYPRFETEARGELGNGLLSCLSRCDLEIIKSLVIK